MRAIFISYRRDDSEGHAGRLFEDLCERFGKGAVFMDVTGIEPGRDFRRVIEQQVESCGVLLAVIGKNWLTAADNDGKRRLDDPADFVRLETASALKRDIPVIPVLVHDAAMPRAEQLPDDLKELAFRNGVELTHARWGSDAQVLIDALLPYVDVAPPAPVPAPPSTGRFVPLIGTSMAVLALGGIGYAAWDRFAPTPAPPPPGDFGLAPGRLVAAAAPASAPLTAAAAPASTPTPTPTPTPNEAAAVVVAAVPASTPGPARASAAAPARAPSAVIDKPVIVTPPPAPKPVVTAPRPASPPTAVPSPSPAPALVPAPVPVPVPAPVPAPTPPAPTRGPSPEVLATRDPGSGLYGGAASVAMVTRTIVIRPDTRYVNVTGGEVVRFDVDGKSFVWNFNGTRSSFDLELIAPAGLLGRKVTAYVAPNPLYPKRG